MPKSARPGTPGLKQTRPRKNGATQVRCSELVFEVSALVSDLIHVKIGEGGVAFDVRERPIRNGDFAFIRAGGDGERLQAKPGSRFVLSWNLDLVLALITERRDRVHGQHDPVYVRLMLWRSASSVQR